MIWGIAFGPDGRSLASSNWDCTVRVFDVTSGALRWSGAHTSHVNSVAFSPDGRVLAKGGKTLVL